MLIMETDKQGDSSLWPKNKTTTTSVTVNGDKLIWIQVQRHRAESDTL